MKMNSTYSIPRRYDKRMGYFYACPNCSKSYVSTDDVTEHLPNCETETEAENYSGMTLPKILNYTSLNPNESSSSEYFPVRHEIIKQEVIQIEDGPMDSITDFQDNDEVDPLEVNQDLGDLDYEPSPCVKKSLQTSNINRTRRRPRPRVTSMLPAENVKQISPGISKPETVQSNPGKSAANPQNGFSMLEQIISEALDRPVPEQPPTDGPKWNTLYTPNSPQQFTCDLCQASFNSIRSLKSHRTRHFDTVRSTAVVTVPKSTGQVVQTFTAADIAKLKLADLLRKRSPEPVAPTACYNDGYALSNFTAPATGTGPISTVEDAILGLETPGHAHAIFGFESRAPAPPIVSTEIADPAHATTECIVPIFPKPAPPSHRNEKRMGRAPLYPSAEDSSGKRWYYCAFPGCSAFFGNRVSRWQHHKTHQQEGAEIPVAPYKKKKAPAKINWRKAMEEEEENEEDVEEIIILD